MAAPATVDEYIAGFPPEVAERLARVRAEIVEAVSTASGTPPEQKVRYGIAAVMLGGRYALHFAGWKKHIGLYPVPTLPEPLESEIAPYRAEKDSVVVPHSKDVPYELIGRVAREIADERVRQSAAG
ncbi:iron chaperone [Microbacterium sp. C23T]